MRLPFLLYLLILKTNSQVTEIKPNIVLIIADDLGWGDVGFTNKHNSTWIGAETPHLDNLAAESIVLDNLYTQAMCTPTRASLMTGKYPFRLGWLFAASVILAEDEVLNHRLVTEELSENFGYKVHGVGKWHLGFRYPNTPLGRGFDSFYGCYGGGIDHFTHEGQIIKINGDGSSTWTKVPDFHHDKKTSDNVMISRDISEVVAGRHSTDLFTEEAVRRIAEHDGTDPMFLYLSYTAPHSPLDPVDHILSNRNQHIADSTDRQYAAMVTQIDDGIGRIVKTLKERKMWSNTVFMFMSDHGASVIRHECWDTVGGSNLPFRDGKATFFEGGIKSAALVWTPWLTPPQRGSHSTALLHAVDIHTFILAAARDNISVYQKEEETSSDLDAGSFLVNVVRGDSYPGRETILHNLVTGPLPGDRVFEYCVGSFPYSANYAVLRYMNFKLFYGDGVASICESDFLVKSCDVFNKTSKTPLMLFDLSVDPFEKTDVAELYPETVNYMIQQIKQYKFNALDAWM